MLKFFKKYTFLASLDTLDTGSKHQTDRIKRQDCFQDWHNKCKRDQQCCSRFCYRPTDDNGYKWKWGLCKPSKQYNFT